MKLLVRYGIEESQVKIINTVKRNVAREKKMLDNEMKYVEQRLKFERKGLDTIYERLISSKSLYEVQHLVDDAIEQKEQISMLLKRQHDLYEEYKGLLKETEIIDGRRNLLCQQ